jgi:hypothetical protein
LLLTKICNCSDLIPYFRIFILQHQRDQQTTLFAKKRPQM